MLIPGLGRNWNTTIHVTNVGGKERLIDEGLTQANFDDIEDLFGNHFIAHYPGNKRIEWLQEMV